MSNLSQFIGGVAGARVGDIVEIYSNKEIVTDGGKTYLQAGVEVLSSDYPNFPTSKINKFNYRKRNNPRIRDNSSVEFSIDTDGNGVWVMFNQQDNSLWRSEDNGITWTCVFVMNKYFSGTNSLTVNDMFPVISNNLIGTWVFHFEFYDSAIGARNTLLYSEDNGKTWQFLSPIPLGMVNVIIGPYTRELVGASGGDGVVNGPYGYYSRDFGRNWNLVGTGNSNIPDKTSRPAFAPDGTYIIPTIDRWDGAGGFPVMSFTRFSGTTSLEFVTSTQQSIGASYTGAGATPASIAFNSDGFMFLSTPGFVRRNRFAYDYRLTSLEDISTALSMDNASFLASRDRKVVYAANTQNSVGRGFKISTDNGTTWSTVRNAQDGKYPVPFCSLSAMGKNGKIIGSCDSVATTSMYTRTTQRLGDIYVIANVETSLNVTNIFPTINKLEKVNSSSFIAYSTRELTLYKGDTANSFLTPIYEPGNTRIFAMASNETLANVVISDLTVGQIRYSNNGLWTNGTINISSYLNSPACNIFVDSVNIRQNSAESGFSYTTREAQNYYLGFSSDGTKMYTMGIQKGNLDQYTLSTAWDPSTASYASKFLEIKTKEASPYAGYFKPDGTQFYTVGASRNVHQWTLSTAWDVSTGTYNTHCSVASSTSNFATGIAFSANGRFMYINATGDDRIVSYRLNESWNIASANGAQIYSRSSNFQLNGGINDGTLIGFSPNGKRLYYSAIGYLYEMGLTTPYDITTLSLAGSTVNYRGTPFTMNETSSPTMFIKPDGKRLYVTGHTGDNVYSFEMNTSPSIPPIRTAAGAAIQADVIADICYANGVFVAVSAGGVVIRSVDTGITWDRRFVTDIHTGAASSVYSNRFIGVDYPTKIRMSSNGTTILINSYEIYRSTDYGNTFSLVANSAGFKIPTKIATDNNGVWAYSDYHNGIVFSYDDGISWARGANDIPPKIGLGPSSNPISSSNLASIDVEVNSSNCIAVIFGQIGVGDANTFVYLSNDDGSNWESIISTIDTQANSTSKCIFVGNTFITTSNIVSQGGFTSSFDTIGLLTYKTTNDYLRVE